MISSSLNLSSSTVISDLTNLSDVRTTIRLEQFINRSNFIEKLPSCQMLHHHHQLSAILKGFKES